MSSTPAASSPLVSIMIPNRNHGAYLPQCIESALNQTYPNTEVILLDNCSDDRSVEIASRYLSRGLRVCRNPQNISLKNYDVLSALAGGKYIQLLCADDFIAPSFIEKAVDVLESHPNVGFVHCDRDYVSADGTLTELDPFFSCSFVAPGAQTAPLFMLSEIGLASQCLMRRSAFDAVSGFDTEFDHAGADKELWFRLSLRFDYGYLRERLAYIRVHDVRETNTAFNTFFHPLALYLTLANQIQTGKIMGLDSVVAMEARAFEKLALECARIASTFASKHETDLARKYLLFARLMHAEIDANPIYREVLSRLDGAGDAADASGSPTPEKGGFFSRRARSYPPPSGFVPLDARAPS